MSKGFNAKNHAVFKLLYQLIFVTKYRHRCITGEMLARLTQIMRETLPRWECSLIDMDGEADHVHLVFDAHPSLDLSILIGNLKSVSSRHIRREYAGHLRRFFWKPYFWSRSYCVVSVGGGSLETLKRYLEQQATPD